MSNSKILLGFVAGAAVGALAGVLFAPDKGSETRKKVTGKAGDITDSIKSTFGDFVEGLKNAYTGTKEDAEALGEKAKAKMSALKADANASLS